MLTIHRSLPTFFLADSTDGFKHHAAYYLTRGGSDPVPAYSLHHADPSSPTSSNCYAAALFDAYNPDVLFGEVLIRPKWTHPTLSQDEVRRHGGIPPPPEPIMPTAFTIQLYNPDLQIDVTRETGLLGSSHYDFAMPQDTFRMPSGSMLDRTQHDPGASSNTPKINFRWKKESKLNKDMTLYVKGKSTDVIQKKKNKEPDIAVALFKSLREITIYEPNLHRVEMEDSKGLEVTLLLVATVIRDVFYGQMRQVFNISEEGEARRRSSSAAAQENALLSNSTSRPSPPGSRPPALAAPSHGHPTAAGTLNPPQPHPSRQKQSPITDPRTQWQLDAETSHLRAQADSEAREQRRQQDLQRRKRECADLDEAKRLRRMVEAEEKEARKRQREVDKETERLRRIYGGGAGGPQSAPLPQSGLSAAPPPPQQQQPYQPQYQQQYPPNPQYQYPPRPSPSPSPRPQQYSHTQYPQHSQRPPSRQKHSTNPSLPAGLNALNLGASMNNLLPSSSKDKDKERKNRKKKSMWDIGSEGGGGRRDRGLGDDAGAGARGKLISQRSSVF